MHPPYNFIALKAETIFQIARDRVGVGDDLAMPKFTSLKSIHGSEDGLDRSTLDKNTTLEIGRILLIYCLNTCLSSHKTHISKGQGFIGKCETIIILKTPFLCPNLHAQAQGLSLCNIVFVILTCFIWQIFSELKNSALLVSVQQLWESYIKNR